MQYVLQLCLYSGGRWSLLYSTWGWSLQYCSFAFSFIVGPHYSPPGVSSGKVSHILQDSGGGHCSTLVVLQLCFYSGVVSAPRLRMVRDGCLNPRKLPIPKTTRKINGFNRTCRQNFRAWPGLGLGHFLGWRISFLTICKSGELFNNTLTFDYIRV